MKLTKAILILGIVLLLACKNNEEEFIIPPGILSQSEMVQLLVDVHIADAFTEVHRIESAEKLLTLKNAYFEDVLKKHNLTQEEFDASLYFYQNNLGLYHETYTLVLEELSVQEAKFE